MKEKSKARKKRVREKDSEGSELRMGEAEFKAIMGKILKTPAPQGNSQKKSPP